MKEAKNDIFTPTKRLRQGVSRILRFVNRTPKAQEIAFGRIVLGSKLLVIEM